MKESFDSEDLILGVRIYTKGGSVVSLTGQVIGEEIDKEEEDKNAKVAKGKKKDKETKDEKDKKETKDEKDKKAKGEKE